MKRFTIPLVVAAVAFLSNAVFGQEAVGIPDDIIKELDVLVGTWKVEGKIGEKEVTGTCMLRWVRGEDGKKFCLLGRGTYKVDGKTKTSASLMGWNAAAKCIEDRGFDTEGGSGISIWTVTSPGTWKGELRMVENGKEATAKSDFIVKGPTEIVMESQSETGEVARFVFRNF
ncbi:MAG: hypothetical protein ACYC0X_19875 [Pirellulaceae bacterium]